MISGYIDSVEGACGIGHANSFFSTTKHKVPGTPSWYRQNHRALGDIPNQGGCGWLLASFIPTPECKQAYEALIGKHPLIYQSPVRKNINSGRDFFFCMFDTGQPDDDAMDTEF